MNKKEFEFLTKVFEADMFNTQFYSESKLAKKLIKDGLVREIIKENKFGNIGTAIFKYLTLTDLGHLNYCMACGNLYDIDDNGNIIKANN